jgi:alpha-mannosidase
LHVKIKLLATTAILLLAKLAFCSPTESQESYFSAGRVFIASSSHQDIAWMDTPAACRNYRINDVIRPALEMMRKDPHYCFDLEDTLELMEFLQAHPELRDEVLQRVKDGRLGFGAGFNAPYESWMSGEELAREMYFGRRWLKQNLPGADSTVYFNPDPPGRAMQMQQILAKAGVKYMFISRFHEGLWRWESPDGGSVLAYSPGHYGNHLPFLNGSPDQCLRAIAAKLGQQSPYYAARQIPPVYGLINMMDFSRPKDFSPLFSAWNTQTNSHPVMSYSALRGFFEAVDQPAAHFDTVLGERPDVWLYITGPTHHLLASAKREAARLLPAAETFTTFACLLKNNFAGWPSNKLNEAWKDEIYVDHGIGGNNGHITDEVFFNKIRHARDTGRALLDQALNTIAADVKTDPAKGIPVTIFNDLSWQRSDVVEMDLPETIQPDVSVVDGNGKEVPSQITTLDSPDEVDVAAAAMGSTATASSQYSDAYGPEKAINGKWAVCDPSPEVGQPDKWNSAAGAQGPHWLTIDFGQPRTVFKIVVRHQGVIGMHDEQTRDNTADFQLQSADSASGPWTNLVPPATGNTFALTTHTFAPKSFRFLRLYITKGTQTDNSYARIFEVQAFEKIAPKPKLIFIADDVPSLGYKTCYLVSGKLPSRAPSAQASAGRCENEFYRVALTPGGIQSIFDKQRNRELLDTKKFLGGEVFTMYSPGTGAGEFGAVEQPKMDATFDRVATHKPEWKLIENGPVRAVYQLEQPLADTTVRQRLVVWNQINRLDCDVTLEHFNGDLYREFRMALPLAMDQPQVAYEVPFGIVRIGKDEIPMTGGLAYGGLNYWQPCRDIRPRLVQDFVDASDDRGGLTMSSSVSAFDWVDPTTTNTPSGTMLQPILLASRRSCNGNGNWYVQAGDHDYRFALTTHDGDWRNGRKDGIGANHPFHVVSGVTSAAGASLPPEMSFASVSAGNVIVSTIKKCEDDDSVIARVYDIEGKNSEVALKLFKPIQAAEKTSLIEEDGAPLTVTGGSAKISVGQNAIETVKLHQP